MPWKPLSLLCAIPLFLSACTPAMEITQPPVRVTPKNPGSAFGIDVFAGARQSGAAAPAYRGERLVTVRTALAGSNQSAREIAGARCRIDSQMYSAEVTTPAEIIVPDYGQASPVITAICRANGKSAQESISVFNASQRARDQAYDPFIYGGFGWPNGRSGVGVGITFNLSGSRNDTYEYPSLRVVFPSL